MTTTDESDFDPMDHDVPPDDLAVVEQLCVILKDRCRRNGVWPFTAVEVGTWAGRTARVLAEHADVVFCVDHWEGSPGDRMDDLARHYGPRHAFTTFCRNMGDLLHRKVYPCVGRSLTWASVWQHPIDLVYIDADHSYEAVRADIAAWMPHLRGGGIIAGHDCHMPGVGRAVEELLPSAVIRSNIWIRDTSE